MAKKTTTEKELLVQIRERQHLVRKIVRFVLKIVDKHGMVTTDKLSDSSHHIVREFTIGPPWMDSRRKPDSLELRRSV